MFRGGSVTGISLRSPAQPAVAGDRSLTLACGASGHLGQANRTLNEPPKLVFPLRFQFLHGHRDHLEIEIVHRQLPEPE